MKINKNQKILGAVVVSVGLAAIGYVIKKKYLPRVPLKEYKEFCMEFAVIDDEICRNELMGNTIGGKEILFGSKGETVKHRYHVFKQMYISYTKEMLENEREVLYTRLAQSKQYADAEKQDLTLEFEY